MNFPNRHGALATKEAVLQVNSHKSYFLRIRVLTRIRIKMKIVIATGLCSGSGRLYPFMRLLRDFHPDMLSHK